MKTKILFFLFSQRLASLFLQPQLRLRLTQVMEEKIQVQSAEIWAFMKKMSLFRLQKS